MTDRRIADMMVSAIEIIIFLLVVVYLLELVSTLTGA